MVLTLRKLAVVIICRDKVAVVIICRDKVYSSCKLKSTETEKTVPLNNAGTWRFVPFEEVTIMTFSLSVDTTNSASNVHSHSTRKKRHMSSISPEKRSKTAKVDVNFPCFTVDHHLSAQNVRTSPHSENITGIEEFSVDKMAHLDQHRVQQERTSDIDNVCTCTLSMCANSHDQPRARYRKRVAASLGCGEMSLEVALETSEYLRSLISKLYSREKIQSHVRVSEVEKTAAELAHLRSERTAAEIDLGKLRNENREYAMNEAAATAKLAELRGEWTRREAITTATTLIIGKALMLKEKAEIEASACIEVEKLRSNLADVNRDLSHVLSDKAILLEEKLENENVAKVDMEQLRYMLTEANRNLAHALSDKAALLKEKLENEDIARLEMEKLRSSLADASREVAHVLSDRTLLLTEKLQKENIARLEMEKLRSSINCKDLEVIALNHRLIKVLAEKEERTSQAAAEFRRLSREMEESQSRAAAALEKLRSTTHSDMHVAFLINCGLLQPE